MKDKKLKKYLKRLIRDDFDNLGNPIWNEKKYIKLMHLCFKFKFNNLAEEMEEDFFCAYNYSIKEKAIKKIKINF